MSILCDQCGKEILPLANYCSYCGADAPHKTVVFDDNELSLKEPVFCPACGKPAPKDALYCAFCGEYLYQLPKKNNFYCPKCNEKNNVNAKICTSCGMSFSDWFSMKGFVAENIGFKGNIILHETMNDVYYHFITDNKISIGRSPDNDIVMSSPWVSGKHCIIDFKQNSLVDLKSKNGTYVNRNGNKINSFSLDQIFEFNIAGSFTFKVIQLKNAYLFRLTAILNQDLCRKISNMQELDELRKHYFIFPYGDVEIYIYKITGAIDKIYDKIQEAYCIKILNNYYYFSDFSENINNRLILKDYKNIPVNWEINIKK